MGALFSNSNTFIVRLRALGTCKGMFVPEDNRSGIYNVFRVPLNALVLGVLLTHLSSETVFVICGGLLGLASIFAKKVCL